jgi:TPR repeat protein
MYQLAQRYERGRGVKKDQAKALEWYTKAGDAGLASAQYTLGETYEKGRLGVAKDKAKALEWYRKAAAQGNKDAADKVKDLAK